MSKVNNIVKELRRLSYENRPTACLSCEYEHGCSTMGCKIINDAIEKIEQLDDFLSTQCAHLLKRLQQEEEKLRWIPVTERLPEDGTYLCTMDGELVGQDEPFTSMCGIENGAWDEQDCVLAWMPLPEPYREPAQNGTKDG